MVGGKVVEVIKLEGQVWVNTQEQVWYPPEQGFRAGATCAIYVKRNAHAELIQNGDSLWWQGSEAYWTPSTHEVQDFPIPRVGYSGAPRP